MVMDAAPDWRREELVTLAWCWRLSRRDGVVVGLTSHDRALTVGGIYYRAAPGMKPSAVETSDAIETEQLDLEGAIASDPMEARAPDPGGWEGGGLGRLGADWRGGPQNR